MDRQEVEKQYTDFHQAYGRTLFAIDREKKLLLKKKKDVLANLEQSATAQMATTQQRVRQKCISLVQSLKEQLSADTAPQHEILKVAEYLHLGNLRFQQINPDASVPYLIPFLGHGNIVLAGQGEEIYTALRNITFSALAQTAAGQIKVTVYNPELKDTFSCFSELEQYSMVSSPDVFGKELNELSKEIVTTDGLLKGKYTSLIELRKKSQQAVGQLRLYVIAGCDWLDNEALKKQLLRVSESSIRTGCAFVFCTDEKHLQTVQSLIKKATYLKKCGSGNRWTPSDLPNLEVNLTEVSAEQADTFLAAYITQSENSAAVTIPFDTIENVNDFWTESSAEGVTFSLGKVGLETVTLRLGDKTTQLHNVLITGAPGKGKSNLLEVMIHSMCCRYSPDELELYLLDFKDGLTFKPYSYSPQFSWLPHAKVLGLESARDFGVAVLEHIEAERQNRALRMNEVEASSVAAFRAKRPDIPMPRIILLIDEYQKIVEIADDLGKRAAELIENIVRQGRACGIHMVLASQTVAHGAALMGREDQIYPAFPVRIALQNTLQESYATFVQGNDAAAKLRVRGEAVINVNYGAIDSNQKLSVAFAEPNAMLSLRKSWCKDEVYSKRIPMVFSKNDEFNLLSAVPAIKKWRNNVVSLQSAPVLPCGQLISVSRKIVSVRMSNDAGRNIAILGSGDGERKSADTLPPNYAVGLVQGMAISLALQHPSGNARFYLINGLDQSVANQNGIPQWLRLMERFGFPVEMVSLKEAPAFFVNLSNEIKATQYDEDNHYILALAMDRCSGMAEPIGNDIFNPVSGASAFQELLKSGPSKGVHTIAWWSNVAMYRDHIGFNGDGYIDTKILLRLDDATSKNVLGPFVQWGGASHRALIHDATDLQSDLTLIPMSPCTVRDIGRMEAVVWE